MEANHVPKRTSYGVLVQNEHGQVLLAHVTGHPQWDIPKGGGEPGEAPLQAALRECYEETGIRLQPQQLRDLGRVHYRKNKALHLFHAQVSTREVDISQCVCHSHFTHRQTQLPTPEMDGFRWSSLSEVEQYCIPAMAAVIAQYARPALKQAA